MRTRGTAMRWGTSLVTSALVTSVLAFGAVGRGDGEGDTVVRAAAATYLCTGYAGCNAAGYSDAGYGAVSNRMYWNMYSGHNCTNYAAYRVIQAGGPATRPWSGNGNASQWGLRMASITDNVPNVGAIAWWAANDNGRGSAGHVAYVERVVSANEIIVSEDAWGGTFHWERITKSSGRWPTGFIHFTDKRITATSPATVSGTPAVGQTLGVVPMTWSTAPTAILFDWRVDGVPTGITTPTFTVRPDDLGKAVSVVVTGARTGYTSAVVPSAPTAAVAKGTFVQTQPTVVTGATLIDNVLTASPGVWSPAPTTSTWRWYADGARIADAAGPQLPLTSAYLGKVIEVVPVARTAGYTSAVGGRVTVGTVYQGVIGVTEPFAVTGTPKVGETLTAAGGATDPADATRGFQWTRDGAPIAGATAPAYQLTPADAGRQVGVQVTLTRPNFAPATQAPPTPGRVTSPARVVVRASETSGVARIAVKIRAAGVSPVRGKVVVRIDGTRTVARLVKGNAVVKVPVRSGKRRIVVRYLGSTAVPAQRAESSLTVR